MRSIPFPLRSGLAGFLLAIVVPVTASAGWSHDPAVDSSRLNSTGFTSSPIAVSDGAGGAIVAFRDLLNSNVGLQRVTLAQPQAWGAAGIHAGTAGAALLGAVADGAGGCIVLWATSSGASADLVAQRFDGAGNALWTAGGVSVCSATGQQSSGTLLADGLGGAFFAWEDYRSGAGPTDVYVQHLNATGVPQGPVNGAAVCTAAEYQLYPVLAPDGSTGAYVAWFDWRAVSYAQPWVQHVSRTCAAGWTANGVCPMGVTTTNGGEPQLVANGHGGVIVVWNQQGGGPWTVYAQHLDVYGNARWTTGGVLAAVGSSHQSFPKACTDGASGVIVAWHDFRNASIDIYAQRLSGLGSPLWGTAGLQVSGREGDQTEPQLMPDGANGAIVSWYDAANGSDYDVSAQHVAADGALRWAVNGAAVVTRPGPQSPQFPVLTADGGALVAYASNPIDGTGIYCAVQYVDRWGVLGGAAPAIVSVRDVPNDQGGQVSIRWTPSWLDVAGANAIGGYWIWRQVPQLAAQSALAAGSARLMAAGESPRAGVRTLRATPEGATTWYWELAASASAQGIAGYSALVATTGDSVGGSNPRTVFMVEARSALVSGQYWDSAPDSGYSVDNLAPSAPAAFTGNYSAGSTSLRWLASDAADLAAYLVYRGPNAAFVPGAANLVATTTELQLLDPAGAPAWYKLVAVDVHGNRSAVVALLPTGTADVGDARRFELALGVPAPNPMGARATVAFTLPAEGRATLALFDATGRRVRVLADGVAAAGEHHVTLEPRDASGRRLPAGVYLLRLQAAGRELVRRTAIVP